MSRYVANLLGALSLSVTDLMEGAVAEVTEQGGQLGQALVLLALRPGMSIKRTAERLRLSHSGAVRLVDRLAVEGWAQRTVGADRRVVRVTLTDTGRAEVERLRLARGTRLQGLVGALTDEERQALETIAEKLLRRLTTDPVTAYTICRLCDTPVCEARGCPVETEARARFLPTSVDNPGAR